MFLVIRLLIVAAIGAGLGLGSVWLALTDPRFDPQQTIGPWEVVGDGALDNPYAAARAARAGRIGLGPAEGVAFLAERDQDGVPLDPACHYRVEGAVPPAALWTLVVTDRAGRPPVNPAGRIGFTNRDVLRRPDGTISITVGPTVRPYDVVTTGSLTSLALSLRVYASRLAGDMPGADDLPQIRRIECAGTGGPDAL